MYLHGKNILCIEISGDLSRLHIVHSSSVTQMSQPDLAFHIYVFSFHDWVHMEEIGLIIFTWDVLIRKITCWAWQ